jgi:hypothetical protein
VARAAAPGVARALAAAAQAREIAGSVDGTRPAVDPVMLNKTDELKSRVEAKVAELQARLKTLKADGQAKAIEEHDRVKRKLDEVEIYVKEGWQNLSDKVAAKLNDWLKS